MRLYLFGHLLLPPEREIDNSTEFAISIDGFHIYDWNIYTADFLIMFIDQKWNWCPNDLCKLRTWPLSSAHANHKTWKMSVFFHSRSFSITLSLVFYYWFHPSTWLFDCKTFIALENIIESIMLSGYFFKNFSFFEINLNWIIIHTLYLTLHRLLAYWTHCCMVEVRASLNSVSQNRKIRLNRSNGRPSRISAAKKK